MSSIPAAAPEWRIEWSKAAAVRGLIVAAAFAAVFYNLFDELRHYWWNYADWSHGWIVPLFSTYLVYSRWDVISRCPIKHTWVGLLVMLAGLALYQYTLWGLVFGYVKHFAMLVCLLGIVLFLWGLPVLRHIWVPWLYLFFAIPLPKGVYFALTDPLRRIAATGAVFVLELFPSLDRVERIGSTIEYYYNGVRGELNVHDACSGMRSMITLCALGTAVAFVAERPMWQRLVLLASCIPIAVFSNFIRVVVTSMLHIYVDESWATGTPHTVLGLVTMGIALLLFMALSWLLGNLTVEVADGDRDDGVRATL